MFPALLFLLILAATPAPAFAQLRVAEEARAGLDLLYQGDIPRAVALFRTLQAQQPEHPLGYLLEANALWWERWCSSLDMKPEGWVDAAPGLRLPLDTQYAALVKTAERRAEALRRRAPRAAESHFYLGMVYAMEGSLHALRRENRAVASAGKKMRAALLRAHELDPELTDALFGLGLYNYYVDTLSPLVKLLRVLLFIPGGDKKVGLEQLTHAAERGMLVATEARFWLAKNLRNHDRDFARARAEFDWLARHYPQNPVFPLLVAGVAAKQGDSAAAVRSYERVRQLARGNSPCDHKLDELAARALGLLSP